MPNFAANITMLFQEHDFLDRFTAAAKEGFQGVEYLFPYDYDTQQLVERLTANGLTQVLHNLPAGDWGAGERGIAIFPDRQGEFQDGVGRAIEYANALGCPQVNCLAGIVPEGVDEAASRDAFVDNMKFAAGKLKDEDIKLLIEPINTRDIPGFFLTGTTQALDIIADTGSDNIWVQYDIYHMQIMEGDLAPTMKKHLDRIAHIQFADNPGRHEPGTGEINYQFLFNFLDGIGYGGWIGCEYIPATTTAEGLGWYRPYAGTPKAV
jgi:hydroxypyruvate isomerase